MNKFAAAAGLMVVGFGWASDRSNAQQNPYPSYPVNATPVASAATFTATTNSVALAAQSGKRNYACGFTITSGGTTTAVVGTSTLVGTAGTTLQFAYVFVSSGQGALGVVFSPCIPASATNTTLTLSISQGSTGTIGALNVWGYRQ